MRVKCNKCGYSWDSGSELKYVSCPSCISKVRNPAWKKTEMKAKKG